VPDWIQLYGRCRIEKLSPDERAKLLVRLHRCVRRGFRTAPTRLARRERLDLWRSIARGGFHDFSDNGWQKNHDSPFVESYDYLSDYLEGGLSALNPYRVYSAVLGTHDYSVEDFLRTRICEKVRTIVEPMAGSAEFAYHGHFHFPDFRYLMFDLDAAAKEHVLARFWLPDTEHHYMLSNVLDEEVWQLVKSQTTGESLCYLGKQGHHFFGPKQLLHLMSLATRHSDYLMLEVPQPSLVSDLDEVDELTRPEMEDAGFHVALVDLPDERPNPITNRMGFRLDAWDRHQRRTLFEYRGWTSWQLPMVVALAEILGLQVSYYHSVLEEFLSVEEGLEDSDLHENVTFLILTRHS
jgi:hypothetical protein